MRLGLEKIFKKEVEMPRSKKLDEVEKKKEDNKLCVPIYVFDDEISAY